MKKMSDPIEFDVYRVAEFLITLRVAKARSCHSADWCQRWA